MKKFRVSSLVSNQGVQAANEIEKLRAEISKMREVLREFQCSCIGDTCDDYGQPYKPLCERDKARKLVEREW